MVSSFRALYISEILSEITSQLEDDRQSLSCLARCCKAFSDQALDVLWKRMSLFCPFIPLLPQKVLTLWVRIILGAGLDWYNFDASYRWNTSSAQRVSRAFNVPLCMSGERLTLMLGVCGFYTAAPRTSSQVWLPSEQTLTSSPSFDP